MGGGCSRPRPGHFSPGKEPVPILEEAGWAPGPVWTGAENLAHIGIRSPDLPARSESLFRLRHPGPRYYYYYYYYYYLFITFMQCIYNYIPETNHVSRVYSVVAILYLQFILH